ncbi:MAG TPA: aminotransferase class I/II-fold pyridoxal phosphate-dependent enzyme [Longimicrobiales bacterium]|nr:aminotransferase class I/II-fold pyridoxal phosphate-dependent enzyme [Longimicrobiales bacterium]
MPVQPFVMERWQSHWENRVRYNLSESGVEPLTLGELLELAGERETALDTPLSYGQSNGTEPLRQRIAALYPGAGVDDVVVTNGSAEANFAVTWRLVEPGDAVAALLPTYMQVPGLVEGLGGSLREIPLREETGWQPDPDDITRTITYGTRLVVVTNPQNPTGATLGEEAIDAILSAARAVGAWVLADEVYAGAEVDGEETPSLYGRYERVIATGSLSKAYGLPGLRIGWAVLPSSARELAEDIWARKDYTTISPGLLTDRLAAMALREDVRPRILERTRGIIRQNLEIVRAWARENGLVVTPHRAGAVCLVRYDAPLASDELAERLRVEQDTLAVPGAHFGLGKYLRIGFGIEATPLREGLERVSRLL